MSNKYFYVHNGITVGNASIDASGVFTTTNTTNATTSTVGQNGGALQVAGGASITKDLWVGGGLYQNGSAVITTATLGGGTGVGILYAGTDTAVSANTGTITVWSTATLKSITSRAGGNTTDQPISITNTSQNLSTNTGNALYVAGGIGANSGYFGTLQTTGNGVFGGNVAFNGNVTFNGSATYVLSTNTYYTDNILELHVPPGGVSTPWTSSDGKDIGIRFHYYTNSADTNAALVLAQDTGALEWYQSGAESGFGSFGSGTYGTFKTGSILLTNTTGTNSIGTGALQVAGGVGIGGGLYVGGAVTATTFYGTLTGTAAFANTATNLAGGALGGIPYQLSTGTTSFISISPTPGYVLVSNGTTATWMNPTLLSSSTATGISGGVAGQIPIQAASGITTFISTGSVGDLLQMTSVNTASFISTATLKVGLATTATNITGGVVNATTGIFSGITTVTNTSSAISTTTGALQVVGGVGIGGGFYVGGISTFTNNIVTSNTPIVYDQAGIAVGTTQVTIDTFSATMYRSAKYVITVSNASNSVYQSTEALVIHDGVLAYLQDVSVFTFTTPIMTFTATLSGGNVLLQGTGIATGNTVKVQRIYTTI